MIVQLDLIYIEESDYNSSSSLNLKRRKNEGDNFRPIPDLAIQLIEQSGGQAEILSKPLNINTPD